MEKPAGRFPKKRQQASAHYTFFVTLLCSFGVVSFQNCSNVEFDKDYGTSSLDSSFNGKSIFYTNSSTVPIDIELNSPYINEIRAGVKKLCVPGTQLNNVRQVSQNSEGNLLIADGNNARVLTYLVHDKSGALKFNYCP